MKKFIVAIDGLKYSSNVVKSAIDLAKQSGAHVVGVFLDDVTYHSYKMYELVEGEGITDRKMSELGERDEQLRRTSTAEFERLCRQSDISFSVHHDRNIAIHELFHESVYADLIVIGADETFTNFTENKPTRFIRDLLAETQCPVLIIPDEYNSIDKIAFLYDGQPSSVHAIRNFSYLFPGLTDKKVEVVSVDTKPALKPVIPQAMLIKEFMKRRFANTTYVPLDGIPENEIIKHFQFEKNTVIVCGAYRRGSVSRWFRPSMADTLMQELRLPIFVAHS
ncbi:MAG: universal stress protein [Chitinophagaceae bacterium]|nr:MAG: universal stress protein [Chitinophagaceae bacterium]